MSQPFISVVMPVYKVENYLRPAVESLLRQTFSDYEIILVDDASPDQRSHSGCDSAGTCLYTRDS